MKAIGNTLILVLALGALPAQAGLFDDAEARKRIDDLRVQIEAVQRSVDARFARIEADVQDRRALVDLASQLDALRVEVARLRGSIEVLSNQNEQLDKRSKDLYADLDGRLRKIEQARLEDQKARDERAQAERASAQDAASETKVYDAALNQFKLGNYKAAIDQFQGFITQYPSSQLAPSAQYWVGNAHYALRDYKASILAQQQLIKAWPDNAKAPDAMLNIASSQAELGDVNGARQTLRSLVDRYPKSPAADQARQRLQRRS